MGFGCPPSFLAEVCGVYVWVCIFPARRFFSLGCSGVWPLAHAVSVSRHPLVGLPVAWGCAGVAMGGVSRPPFFFFFFLFSSGCGGPVVSWLCGVRCCLFQSWPPQCPSPPSFFALVVSVFFLWPVARQFSGAVCGGVSLVSFPPSFRRSCGRGWPLPSARSRLVGQDGPPVFFRGAPWVLPSMLPG